MKNGWYVGNRSRLLYLKSNLGGIQLGEEMIEVGNWGDDKLYRPATKQDIIDLLLPTIPEPKEPGQVAYETWACAIGDTTDWKSRKVDVHLRWALVEQAVKDSLKEKA